MRTQTRQSAVYDPLTGVWWTTSVEQGAGVVRGWRLIVHCKAKDGRTVTQQRGRRFRTYSQARLAAQRDLNDLALHIGPVKVLRSVHQTNGDTRRNHLRFGLDRIVTRPERNQ